jgi:voltage-gated potassium channel
LNFAAFLIEWARFPEDFLDFLSLRSNPASIVKLKRLKSLDSLQAFLITLKREKIFAILAVTSLIMVGGAVFIYLLERGVNKGLTSLGDAVYWAIIYMTTTGYGDITPSTAGGRIIAVVLVLSGLVLLSLITATVASVFVEKKIREGKGLEPITWKDHIVLCGWNRNAGEVIEGLLRTSTGEKIPLVLVNELSEEEWERLKFTYRDHDFRFLRGDFTQEDVLARANIARARAVILLADTSGQRTLEKADDRTLLATLAIKSMAPEVRTCAELLNPENRQHLNRANVDEVVIRGEHVGSLLAEAGLSPGLPRVISHLLSPEGENKLWKVPIPPHFIGKTVAEFSAHLRKTAQAILIALLNEKRGLSLGDILTDDYSAIDQFIKRKFEEAGKDLAIGKERILTTLNPPDDRILTQEDAAVVIARTQP